MWEPLGRTGHPQHPFVLFITARLHYAPSSMATDNITAIDKIRASTILSELRYLWIRPLIEKTLANEMPDEDDSLIEALIDQVLPQADQGTVETGVSDGARSTDAGNTPADAEAGAEPRSNEISMITAIKAVSNVGLVDVTEPIPLSPGLNIFYGRNGSGKSSIYLALCRCLGMDKVVHPNLHSSSTESSCEIVYSDSEGQKHEVSWRSPERNPVMPVIVFDSEISSVLVEQDQVNTFELAHLKMEYFSYLASLYERTESAIARRKGQFTARREALEEDLQGSAPFVLEPSFDLGEQSLSAKTASDEDLRSLIRTQKEVETLSKDNPTATLKNIRSAQLALDVFLPIFGRREKTAPLARVS